MERRRVAAVTAIALAAALLGAVACEQVLSIDGAVTVAPHDACGLPMSPGSCQSCVASSCCTQASACAADQRCSAYESCLLACDADYECRTRCAISQTGGVGAAVAALDQCVVASCNDACGMQCGITAAPTYPDAGATCETCMQAKACLQARACGASLECETIEHCLPGCATVDCHNNCIDMDDSGTFTALEVAIGSGCLKACNVGNFWLCVGGVSWPLAPASGTDVEFTVLDTGENSPVAGAVVKACPRTDDSCVSPVLPAVTANDAGSGVFHFPGTKGVGLGFEGYYDIEAPDAEQPLLVFAASPLTQARTKFTWSVLSPMNLATLLASAHVPYDPTLGYIVVAAEDCLLSPASGVSITWSPVDPRTQLFYLAGGVLAATKETDYTGFAFLLDVPPGTVRVSVTPTSLGSVSSTQEVVTRPGTVSSVIALPTP